MTRDEWLKEEARKDFEEDQKDKTKKIPIYPDYDPIENYYSCPRCGNFLNLAENPCSNCMQEFNWDGVFEFDE